MLKRPASAVSGTSSRLSKRPAMCGAPEDQDPIENSSKGTRVLNEPIEQFSEDQASARNSPVPEVALEPERTPESENDRRQHEAAAQAQFLAKFRPLGPREMPDQRDIKGCVICQSLSTYMDPVHPDRFIRWAETCSGLHPILNGKVYYRPKNDLCLLCMKLFSLWNFRSFEKGYARAEDLVRDEQAWEKFMDHRAQYVQTLRRFGVPEPPDPSQASSSC
jgi:hypothetical protein